ncbi:MAG: carboxypeptidase-like regulatory domain-containing protein [Tannerella sp.]|nr:carboxypeptidase-like regulatory domain-containing protein [Tannerella sp.]
MKRILKQIILPVVLLSSGVGHVAAQSIEIRGVVKDAGDMKYLEHVNVVLQTQDSVFVTGGTTGRNGAFALGKIAAGDYRLVVSSIGYEMLFLELEGLAKNIALDDILLNEATVLLDGVTVLASNVSNRIDRKIIIPSERHATSSTNGIDLLQKLMLPRVTVNPVLNEVAIAGGGELQLRINGVKVEREDLLALRPVDIVRIEFHDNPGLRYGNAEIVLDYIVRRPETGGDFGINLNDGLTAAWGNNFFNGRINCRKSEFSANYSISHRDFYRMWRNNEETFSLADGSVLRRREKGEPGHAEIYWQNLNVKYNFQDEKKMFNAAFRLYADKQPHWDYRGILYNMENPADAVDMIDRTNSSETRPALDLYYQHSLPKDQTLVFNAVGTYNRTDNTRIYRESRDETLLTDVNNRVDGKKYSFIGESIYEKKLDAKRLSAGIRHSQSLTNNSYRNGRLYETEMQQIETFLYGEFKSNFNKLDYTLGAGVTRSYFEQEGADGYQYYTFNPRIVLFLPLPGQSSIRLRSDLGNSSPSLSDLNAVEQTVDSLQIMRGNPSMNPYMRYRTQLTYEYRKKLIYVNLQGSYEYHPHAIMEEKLPEGDKIIRTWNNQKNWQWLSGGVNLRIGPIKDMFELSVTSQINHYISHGNSYLHRYTNWHNRIEGNFTFKRFIVLVGMQTPWERFYGETMNGGENIHHAMLGYRHKKLSAMLGMFNPFTDNYKQSDENRSIYASYKKVNYIDESSRMVLIQLTYNFSFGRTFDAKRKRLNNADDDSGVMNAKK